MKKRFLSFNDIKTESNMLKPGMICEFQHPIKQRGCPDTKNLKDERNYVDLNAQTGKVFKIDGKKFLKVKRIRDNGFIQKHPGFLIPIQS